MLPVEAGLKQSLTIVRYCTTYSIFYKNEETIFNYLDSSRCSVDNRM